MTYLARIVWNTLGWQRPSDSDCFGIECHPPIRSSYHIGFEEWLFNETLKEKKLGYLDCYRVRRYPIIADKILLHTVDPAGNYFHIGNLYGVKQLKNNEIPPIRAILNGAWLTSVEGDLNGPPILDPRLINGHEYSHCWASPNIVAGRGEGFVLNIKYDKLELLDKWVNLSSLDPNISPLKIQKLSVRYILANLLNNNVLNHAITDYLKAQYAL